MVCNYGSMSGEDPIMPRGKAGRRRADAGRLHPRPRARHRSPAQIRAIYAELGGQVRQGLLTAPVEKVYAIEDIRAAVAHAERGERAGKILVAPGGQARITAA